MKNAERIYKEYMNSLMRDKMKLVILETEDWTNNFAIIKTDWRSEKIEEFIKKDYTLYWIPTGTKSPQPIRAYDKLSEALSVFHLLRYEVANYTEYPF